MVFFEDTHCMPRERRLRETMISRIAGHGYGWIRSGADVEANKLVLPCLACSGMIWGDALVRAGLLLASSTVDAHG